MTSNRYDTGAAFVAALPTEEQRLAAAKPITAWTPAPAVRVDAPELELPVQAAVTVKGDYRDRAAAFNLKVGAMSAVTGVGMMLVATAVTSAPLLSLAALGWFGGSFFAVWLIAYLADAWISPEGAAFMHVLRGWRWLDREQAHRHYVELRERFPQDYEQ